MILIKKFRLINSSTLHHLFSTSYTNQMVKTMKDYVQGKIQNIDINLMLNNYHELDDKLLIDSTMHKYITNKGLDSKLAERIKNQLVFTDSWKNRDSIMKIIVKYYGSTEKAITQLFHSTDWDKHDVKFKTLKILQQMNLNGNQQIEKGLIQLLKNESNKLFICLICNLLSRIRHSNLQYIQKINQMAQNLTLNDSKLIKEFFLIKNYSDQFPNKTIQYFANGLANVIDDYEGQQMLAILTNIYDIAPDRQRIFKRVLEDLEKIFLKDDIHLELLYKYLKVCMKFNVRLKKIANDMANNPKKYIKIFGKKLNHHLVIDILIKEKLEIPLEFIQQIKKQLFSYLQECNLSRQQQQQNFNKRMYLLIKIIKKFNKNELQQISKILFKIIENSYLDKQNLKSCLIVGANITDRSLIQLVCKKLNSVTKKQDYSIILNVWYNIIRLDLNTHFDLKISDIQDFKKFNQAQINYLLYISSKTLKDLNKKKYILDKIEPVIERMCKQRRFFLKPLFLIVKQYSDCPTENKFLYVHLEQNLMSQFSKSKNIEQRDVNYVLNYFKKINRGSKKFYTFANEILKKNENSQRVKKEYDSRAKKFQELRQKQRVDKIKTRQQFQSKKPYKK